MADKPKVAGYRKFRNVPTEVDGIRFASKKEANHYGMLKILERAGKISKLELQPRYRLEVNGILICTYVGDFRYIDVHSGEIDVQDAKGFKTTVYKLKKKLMKAIHGIDIKEI